VDNNEFSKIKSFLGKTQKQMAELLCVSTKTIQSYEQGWRNISAHVEKQMLLYLSLKRGFDPDIKSCWEVKDCPPEWKVNCIVWELKAMHFCWFLNGTFCQGKRQKSWEDKIKICRDCVVYKTMLPDI